eukprot:CAMPEP_0177667766 /NCGR_PEP_ID=MMETSP0447-20121125/22316_1 /TAXON_ID=0 /ORGANISM="Stygamoeba regulata, Strain BSH-02190019" /LENGTH=288 /DNA_ID=CAMNT_0019174055 /DNA_START=23 /DNA_END=889 /DNA_ORIENTATION=-
MNYKAYALRQGSRLFDSGAKCVVFGFGNYFYPYSRRSVGLRLVDRMAHDMGRELLYNEFANSWVADADSFVLAKPRTYNLKEAYDTCSRVMAHRYVNAGRMVMLYHHPYRKFGDFRLHKARDAISPEYLHMFADQLNVPDFYVFSIGIQSDPSRAYLQDEFMSRHAVPRSVGSQRLWLYNQFTEEEIQKLEEVYFPVWIKEVKDFATDLTSGLKRQAERDKAEKLAQQKKRPKDNEAPPSARDLLLQQSGHDEYAEGDMEEEGREVDAADGGELEEGGARMGMKRQFS